MHSLELTRLLTEREKLQRALRKLRKTCSPDNEYWKPEFANALIGRLQAVERKIIATIEEEGD